GMVVVVVEVVVVVDVLVVVVVVMMTTAIVLSMTNGLGPPPGPVPSSRFPPPNTPAVETLHVPVPAPVQQGTGVPAPVHWAFCPPIAGIVQGNGPNCTVTSFARMSVFVKRFVLVPLGAPVASGQRKSTVTLVVLHPTEQMHVPVPAAVQQLNGVPAPV